MYINSVSLYKLEEIPELFQNKDWPAVGSAVAAFSGNIFENDKDNILLNLLMEILAHEETPDFVSEAIIDRIDDIFEDNQDNKKLKDLIFHHAIHLGDDDDNRWKNKKAIAIVIYHRELFENLDLIANHEDEMIQEYIADDLPFLVPRSPSS
jgi:hypothetical protein